MSAMLPSLILRWDMTTGSSRVSVNEDAPPLLPGAFPPLMNWLTAACLLYSSSISCFFLLRRNIHRPPAMAATAINPTTTPTAMPTVLGPDFLVPELEVPLPVVVAPGFAVTTIVEGGRVVFDVAGAEVVEEGWVGTSDAAAVALLTLDVKPVT